MTITERNQKLYELRIQLDKARAEVAWIEQQIWLTYDEYKQEQFAIPGNSLFDQMFSN